MQADDTLARPAEFLLLPHPRTSQPAYFLPPSSDRKDSQFYELQVVKSDRKNRSWFLYGNGDGPVHEGEKLDVAGDGHGWVKQDGALHTLNPIDPALLMLPLLEPLLASADPSAEAGSYLPLDDLFELISSTQYRRLAEAHNAALPSSSKEGTDAQAQRADESGDTPWPDILSLVQYPAIHAALAKLCSTQDLSAVGFGASGGASSTASDPRTTAYRPSAGKIGALLARKLAALSSAEAFEAHPATLGRKLAKGVDMGASKEEERRERVKIAADIVRNYVPVGVKGGKSKIETLFDTIVEEELA